MLKPDGGGFIDSYLNGIIFIYQTTFKQPNLYLCSQIPKAAMR
jgi:hypothetical protein